MIAISAWLDNAAESAVRALWRRQAGAGIDASLHTGPYRPHVTLGVWQEAPVPLVAAELRELAAGLRAVPLTFRAIGIFPGDQTQPEGSAGVYLTPTVTPELRDLHERVHALLEEIASGAVPRHLPGRWEPHCTVAWRLAPEAIPAAVDAVVRAGVLPLEATVTRLGVIETPAEIELESLALAG